MLKNDVHFASLVTVATPCWGFGTQHGLMSTRILIPLLVGKSAAWAHV
jgi:hypothetical protein